MELNHFMWNCNSKKSFSFQNNIYIRLSGNPTNNFKFSIANIFSRRFFNAGLFFYIHVNIFKLWVKLKWLTCIPSRKGFRKWNLCGYRTLHYEIYRLQKMNLWTCSIMQHSCVSTEFHGILLVDQKIIDKHLQ